MIETKVIAREVGSEFFSFIAEEGKTQKDFVADISDIPGQDRTVLSQIWNDACDVGFALVSHVTGRKVIFTLAEEMVDREGEVYGWVFTADPDLAVNRKVISSPLKAVIFND